jgi:serine/threonine-protein kinase
LTLSRDVTPPHVVTAGARVLAKNAAERFATAGEFVAALHGDDGSVASAGTASIPVGATRLSLAVMPVVNRSADVENEYFSDGMTDELINALAKVEGLRVVSRSSVFSFKGKDLPLREIGATLDVAFLLESSVRRAGDRLRVTAQLVRVADDTTLWSETYERVLADVFAVQDDIVRRIVSTITHTMQLGHLRGIVTPRPPRSLEVYDLYLLGRFHWNKRTETGMRYALELFERAVEADPNYAPAYSGIADASALLASWQFASPAEMYPRASAAARRAIELDPASAEAHASLGFVKINWEWDWDGAIASLHRAIALNPSNETAHRWLSAFLFGIGRGTEGLPLAQRALALDPVSVLPRMNLGICYYLSWQFAQAAAEFRTVIERDPAFVRAHVFLAGALSLLGEHVAALTAAEHAEVLFGHHPMGRHTKGYVLATAGDTEAARAIFAELMPAAPPLYRAMGYAALGEDEATIDALEFGQKERGDWMYSIGSQPYFRHLHANPRFVALMQKMHLSNI